MGSQKGILCHVHGEDENHENSDIHGDIEPTADLHGTKCGLRMIKLFSQISKDQ
jgi:hypothetical protein